MELSMKSLFKSKDQRGQTMVEYLLMLVVVVAVMASVFEKLEGYMVSNPDSFLNTYVQGFSRAFNPESGYKRFTIRR